AGTPDFDSSSEAASRESKSSSPSLLMRVVIFVLSASVTVWFLNHSVNDLVSSDRPADLIVSTSALRWSNGASPPDLVVLGLGIAAAVTATLGCAARSAQPVWSKARPKMRAHTAVRMFGPLRGGAGGRIRT